MSGTSKGGQLAYQKNIAKDPDFYRKIGSKGGKTSRGGGFASMPKEKVSMAGRKGGARGRRGPKLSG